MFILLLLLFLIITGLEMPGLLRNKMWRELIAFSVFLFIGMALSTPQVLGFPVPSPHKLLEALFKPLVHWIRGQASLCSILFT